MGATRTSSKNSRQNSVKGRRRSVRFGGESSSASPVANSNPENADFYSGLELASLLYALRVYLYNASIRFAAERTVPLYNKLMLCTHPTDPEARFTPPDRNKKQRLLPICFRNKSWPPRWRGLLPLYFVLIADVLTATILIGPCSEGVFNLGAGFMLIQGICWIALGVPILQLQYILGQFLQGSSLRCFGLLHKRARGIGIASSCLLFLRSAFQIRVLGEALIYLVASLRTSLPGTAALTEGYSYSDDLARHSSVLSQCAALGQHRFCRKSSLYNAEKFYNNTIIGPFKAEAGAKVNLYILVASAVGCVLVMILLYSGLRVLGHVAVLGSVGMLTLLLMFILTSFHSREASTAFTVLFQSWTVSKFVDIEVWVAAVDQMVRTLGVIVAHHTALASFTRVRDHVLGLSWILVLTALTVWYACVVVAYALQGTMIMKEARTSLELSQFSNRPFPIQDLHDISYQLLSFQKTEMFKTLVREDVQRGTGFNGFLMLLSWGAARFPGGASLTILFYVCLSALLLVALTSTGLGLLCSVRELYLFGNVRYGVLIVMLTTYVASVPAFFNYTLPNGSTLSGYELAHNMYLATMRLGVPVVGIAFVLTATTVFTRYSRIIPIQYRTRVVVTFFAAYWISMLNYRSSGLP